MSPTREYERLRECLGDLIKAYAAFLGVELSGYGSWTLGGADSSALESAACFIVGEEPETEPVPDLAIEVLLANDETDKLGAYQRLGIGEVWIWRAGQIEVYVLQGSSYERATGSALFPALDLDLLVSVLYEPTPSRAVRTLQERLHEGRPGRR